MQYQIQSDNMDLSPSMTDLAKSKMAKLDRHFKNIDPESVHARIVMNTAPQDQFEVKIRLVVKGAEYFTDETNFVLETALVMAVEELDRRLEKDKFVSKTEKEWEEQREAKRVSDEDLVA